MENTGVIREKVATKRSRRVATGYQHVSFLNKDETMDKSFEDEERKRAEENAQFKRDALKIARQQNITKLVSTIVAFIGAAVAISTFYAALVPGSAKNKFADVSSSEIKQIVNQQIDATNQSISAVNNRVSQLETQISALSSVPNETKLAATLAETKQSLAVAQQRLKKIEAAILENPEKAISIPLLRAEVEGIKTSSASEVSALRTEVARIYDLNKWFVGLMFTMALGIIGLAVSNFIKPNKDNRS